MLIIDDAFSRRFYPYVDPKNEHAIAAHGYIEVYNHAALADAYAQVRLNMRLEALSAEQWASLKNAVEAAFAYAATLPELPAKTSAA